MRIPPAIIAGLALLGIIMLDRIFPSSSHAFPGQKIIGSLVLVAGMALLAMSVRLFGKANTKITPVSLDKATSLVTTGLYRYTRNPMYLGMAGLITGFGIGVGSLMTLPILAVFVWYISKFQIQPEETALQDIFGSEFSDYCARVRRWI